MSNACIGCGAPVVGSDLPPSNCPTCPPEVCVDCGFVNNWGTGETCLCWVSVEDMPLADLKALFAHDGTFNVGPGGQLSTNKPTS